MVVRGWVGSAALCGLALALLPQAYGRAAAAASPAGTYYFAQSSLGGGGFENVIAADPRHNGVVISGSDVAGLQRSTDYGKTWVAAQNGSINATYHPIAAIFFDPKSPSHVYAATNGGVAESTNDGQSWAPLASLPAGAFFNGSNTSNPSGSPPAERCVGHLLAVDDTTSPHDVYAATFNDGVWMYNGTAWASVVSQTQLENAFCLTSLAWGPGGTLDVATWGSGVFTIQNPSGIPTVQPVTGAPAVVQELAGLADGDVWGAAYTTGVGDITSAGWTTTLPEAGGERYMSIDGYSAGGVDVVIAGSDNSVSVSGQPGLHSVLHETRDSGATWTSLPASTAQVSAELLGPQTGNPWWHASFAPAMLYSLTMTPSSIAIEHEGTGDDLWIAGFGGNWRLLGAEGQTTFYPSDAGLGTTVNHQLAVDPSTSGQPRSGQRVYLGDTDWGMFSSADGFSTQQGISDDQFAGGTVGFDTVVDGGVSPPVVYLGVGNRDFNTQGDLLSAPAPATSAGAFQSLGLAAATGGGRPLAVGVVDTAGTPTLIVAVEGDGIWTRVGTAAWMQDPLAFTTAQPTMASIATGSGAQASTVYAYDPKVGVYRSLDAGAPGSWALIWKHMSTAAVPFLMVDSADPTRLWASASGGLYRLDNAASTATFTGLVPVISGATSGLAELNGQVFTTRLSPGDGLELQVSDSTGANFTNHGNSQLSGTLVAASSIAVASNGTVYIATAGSGLIVGMPVSATTTVLASLSNPSAFGKAVTFTATVSAVTGSDIPTGVVVFWNGIKKLGTATVGGSGVAQLTSSKLTRGSHSIVAKYQGDATDTPSSSAPLIQQVN